MSEYPAWYDGNRHIIYKCFGDQFGKMTLAEALDWLGGIAAGLPCGADEVVFEIEQGGDSWDGYSLAEVLIHRPETEAETSARKRSEAQAAAAREDEARQRELSILAKLKAKYGDS